MARTLTEIRAELRECMADLDAARAGCDKAMETFYSQQEGWAAKFEALPVAQARKLAQERLAQVLASYVEAATRQAWSGE